MVLVNSNFPDFSTRPFQAPTIAGSQLAFLFLLCGDVEGFHNDDYEDTVFDIDVDDDVNDDGDVDVDVDDDDQEGLMGGLKSWLGFAGSMTGTGSTAIAGLTHH